MNRYHLKKVLCKRGMKSFHEVGGGSGREYITVHVCACANGERLPPFILYKGKNMYRRWMGGAPAGTLFGISESGWMQKFFYLGLKRSLFQLFNICQLQHQSFYFLMVTIHTLVLTSFTQPKKAVSFCIVFLQIVLMFSNL